MSSAAQRFTQFPKAIPMKPNTKKAAMFSVFSSVCSTVIFVVSEGVVWPAKARNWIQGWFHMVKLLSSHRGYKEHTYPFVSLQPQWIWSSSWVLFLVVFALFTHFHVHWHSGLKGIGHTVERMDSFGTHDGLACKIATAEFSLLSTPAPFTYWASSPSIGSHKELLMDSTTAEQKGPDLHFLGRSWPRVKQLSIQTTGGETPQTNCELCIRFEVCFRHPLVVCRRSLTCMIVVIVLKRHVHSAEWTVDTSS